MAGFGSLFRMPRRMAGKRMVIGVMCTVCLVLGVYIKYFNHESSDQLLLANRQDVQGADVVFVAKPNFHRLGANKKQEDVSNKDVVEHVQKLAAQNLIETFDEGDTLQEKDNDGGELDEAKHKVLEENEDEWADDHQDVNLNNIHQNEPEHDVDKPIERVEGEDEEEEDELRDAGGDGGEQKDGDQEDDDDEEEEEEKEEERDDKHSTGRGPHGIKLFDWDQWVKENEFVELGNVWGYCDDDDPPVIGKLLLLEDEEKGGVKNIFIFNTTFDEDVVMGKVEISIDFNDMHFYANTFDLADLENDADFFKTPIKKGDHYYVREQHLSSFIPKGHYYGEAKMTDQNERVIVCSTMNLHMK